MSRATLREIALAAVITVVMAAGPFTPNEWGPSFLIGAAVAGAVLAYRLWLRPAPVAAGSEERGALEFRREQLVEGVAWASIALLWGIAFLPTLQWLWWEWTRSVWANDHGIFMPFVMGYLAWNTLRQETDREPDSSAWGLPLLGVAALASLVDSIADTKFLGMAGLLLSLPALSLLLLGARRTRLLRVPLVLSLLMTPIPLTLSTHLVLRYATATGVEPLLRMLGIPVLREDTVIHLPSGTFVVAEACSGFSTLYASIAVALVLVFLTPSLPRKLVILLAAPLLALGANVIRVLALVLIAHFVGRWTLDTPIHEATGVAAFAVVLVGLFALARERTPSETAP